MDISKNSIQINRNNVILNVSFCFWKLFSEMHWSSTFRQPFELLMTIHLWMNKRVFIKTRNLKVFQVFWTFNLIVQMFLWSLRAVIIDKAIYYKKITFKLSTKSFRQSMKLETNLICSNSINRIGWILFQIPLRKSK